MKYSKPPLDFSQQADLLLSRGLGDVSKSDLVLFLQTVNYYRLSGYLYSFKTTDPTTGEEKFKPGTSFPRIKQRYEFDRQLRLLLMDAIERIEVAVLRTQLVEVHTSMFGVFGYINEMSYNPSFLPGSFSKLLQDIQEDEQRSHEEFINRYRAKYFEEQFLPFWMVVEVMSFGQLFTLFRNSDKGLKKNISFIYGVFPPVFDSWLHTLNYIRNACAHHVRLWNRPIPVAPQFPDKKNGPDWHTPAFIQNNKIFAVLTLCQYLLLRIGLDDYWKTNLINLLAANPDIPLGVMGFPVNWRDIQFWK
jgi:abortive infection bacteriophage resistance protein